MIVIYHNTRQVSRVTSDNLEVIDFESSKSIASVLMQLAMQFPDKKVAWCHEDCEEFVKWNEFPKVLHHDKIMVSYTTSPTLYLGNEIGYIEESPFIKVNKKVSYPTWQMSSGIGVTHASVLLQFKGKIKESRNFDYFLNSIAKLGMPLGLLCYSEPKLVTNFPEYSQPKATIFTLFQFVYQHYKTRWLFLLLFNLVIYEKRLPIFAFLKALFYKKRNKIVISLDSIVVQSNKQVVEEATIDVIIPTIGRKKYLYDVLKDLATQTHLPKNVIIVEQNPLQGSASELGYLQNEVWPFTIKHTFTHQAGACNARNLALAQVESEWVFMADDDIRIQSDFIENGFFVIKSFVISILTFGCYEAHYLKRSKIKNFMQWNSFGSGCSFVKIGSIEGTQYNPALEFGYGEDTEFGLQVRNKGIDIVFVPNPEILHLKAPMGGFRIKPNLKWQDEPIQPKPSPTIMYVKQKHNTQEQILGYKTILFFKFYRLQKIKNPFRYFSTFQRQWKVSLFWAKQLRDQNA